MLVSLKTLLYRRGRCTLNLSRLNVLSLVWCGILQRGCGRGSPAVKVTNSRPVCQEFEPSTTETRRVGGMHVKSIDAEAYSCWYGMVIRRGDDSSGVVLVT
ncbi:hypothetical protein TNCV_887681 [Trichonephila clavipes]|nr:hypothetical protein TNCV_887681 [Trichonephila clavipes]